MNRTAYIIAWFKIVSGVPVFKGAGIYSESAQRITVHGETVPMDVFSSSGKDFEEAHANALDSCKQFSSLAWLLPHLAKLGG